MRALLILALGVVAMSASTTGQQGPARDSLSARRGGTGIVRGRVVADDGGLPLTRARVNLSAPGTRLNVEPILTDTAGRFEFAGLPGGRYTITIAKTGYVWGKLGTHDVERSTGFELANGAVLDGLDVRMLRAAAISGRIVDDVGDPVLAASVSVGTLQRVNGQLLLSAARTTVTDDRGEFRVGGLAAGTYVVSVGGEAAGRSLPGAPDEWRRAISWGATYYADAVEIAAAQRLTLKTGEERSGIDLILRPFPGGGARLTVAVTDAAGNPATGIVQFTGRSLVGSLLLRQGRARTPSPIEPGELVVWARRPAGVAMARVMIGGEDAMVSLVLAKGGRMTGRVTIEGEKPSIGPLPITVVSRFRGSRGSRDFVHDSQPLKVNGDGTFELTNLIGQVDFAVSGAAPGWSVQSVTHDGRNLLDTPYDFTGGDEIAGVRVVISTRSPELAGVLVDRQRAPAVGCLAVIFPDDPLALQSGRLTRRIRSDLDGRFRITGLNAGDYRAFAARRLDPVDWSAPEYLTAWRSRAIPFKLSAGEPTNVTLECADQP